LVEKSVTFFEWPPGSFAPQEIGREDTLAKNEL